MGALSTGLGIAGGVVGTLLVAWPVAIWLECRRLEKPRYSVVRPLAGSPLTWWGKKPKSELRNYESYLIAEHTVTADSMRKAANQGFRAVAGFIFGGNTAAHGSKESIAMTAPVRMEMPSGTGVGRKGESIAMTAPVRTEMCAAGEGGQPPVYKISFTMPSKYTKDTLPKPNNPDVHIREVPARLAAALAFSGNIPSEETVEAQKAALLRLLPANGLKPVEPAMLYQYHPPFAPGWMRLNEIVVYVEESKSQ